MLLYLTCYGIPAVVAYYSGKPFWVELLVWACLAFLLAFLYLFVSLIFWTPRLKLYDGRERDFCSLDLRK